MMLFPCPVSILNDKKFRISVIEITRDITVIEFEKISQIF